MSYFFSGVAGAAPCRRRAVAFDGTPSATYVLDELQQAFPLIRPGTSGHDRLEAGDILARGFTIDSRTVRLVGLEFPVVERHALP